MNSKIDEIIPQKCLKTTYIDDKNVAPRLIDVRQPSKPESALDISRKLKLQLSHKGLPIDYIVPYCIAKNSICLCYAPAGIGKTFWAWGIAKYAYVNKRVKYIHYLDGDNGTPVAFMRNVDELIKRENFFYVSTNNPNIELGCSNHDLLLKYVKSSDKDLVDHLIIIDSMKDFLGEYDVMKGKDMDAFFKELMELRKKGATVIILHHTTKGTLDEEGNMTNFTFSGSPSVRNSIDTAYKVTSKNASTGKRDGYIDYLLEEDKKRLGGNKFNIVVHTGDGKYNVDIFIPDLIQAHIDDPRLRKNISKIVSAIMKENSNRIELNKLYRIFNKNQRNSALRELLRSFNNIIWDTEYSGHKKYIALRSAYISDLAQM